MHSGTSKMIREARDPQKLAATQQGLGGSRSCPSQAREAQWKFVDLAAPGSPGENVGRYRGSLQAGSGQRQSSLPVNPASRFEPRRARLPPAHHGQGQPLLVSLNDPALPRPGRVCVCVCLDEVPEKIFLPANFARGPYDRVGIVFGKDYFIASSAASGDDRPPGHRRPFPRTPRGNNPCSGQQKIPWSPQLGSFPSRT